VSLIGHDDLQCDLRALASDPPWHDAEQPLVARLAHQVPLLARNTIILAALTAKRRVTVEQLAEVSAVSFGTLRYRLREVGAPTVREVLGLFLCAHTVWRLDVLSWSVKQAAAAAGFRNTSALANYVRRHTGLAPCNLARSVGFNGFLESIVEVFFPGKQSRMTRAPDVWHTPIAHHESGWSSVKVI
jgi:AraC-like DNA-binding protein